jgi:hypothetical protein
MVCQLLNQILGQGARIVGASLLEECAQVGEASDLLAISILPVAVDVVHEILKLTKGGAGLAALGTAIAVDARGLGLPGAESSSDDAGGNAESESNEGKLELHCETNKTKS